MKGKEALLNALDEECSIVSLTAKKRTQMIGGAIQSLEEIIKDPDTAPADRLRAANSVLDRAYEEKKGDNPLRSKPLNKAGILSNIDIQSVFKWLEKIKEKE